jgi:hypothetical protein
LALLAIMRLRLAETSMRDMSQSLPSVWSLDVIVGHHDGEVRVGDSTASARFTERGHGRNARCINRPSKGDIWGPQPSGQGVTRVQ